MIPLRSESRRRGFPLATFVLVAGCAAGFAYELSLGAELASFLSAWAFVPERLLGPGIPSPARVVELGRALTSLFLHGGWLHLGGNLLFLWVFGDAVEGRLGPLRFLTFYLGCGLVAALAHAVADPHSTLPAIGASGAIAGILGTYLVLFPRARVQTLIFLGIFVHLARIPALVLLPIWFLLQLFSGLASLAATPTAGAAGAAGGVAWFAHVGGFLAGPIVYFLVRRR